MYKNKADVVKNRLYVTFKGRMDVDEVKTGGANVIQEARKLKPGFGIISDIAEFIPTTEEGRLSMQNTMKTIKELGLGHVVRIVKNLNSVSGSQWQRTSQAVGYSANEVTTLAEAETLLNKLEKK
jgi:hypothetical protein